MPGHTPKEKMKKAGKKKATKKTGKKPPPFKKKDK